MFSISMVKKLYNFVFISKSLKLQNTLANSVARTTCSVFVKPAIHAYVKPDVYTAQFPGLGRLF